MNSEKLAPSFRAREQDEVIRFEKAELGMGHTIARGFSSLAWDFGFLGFLDMPFIQQETLEELKRVAISEKTEDSSTCFNARIEEHCRS